jgi:hypothetical protein
MSADDQADMRLTNYVSARQLAANRRNAQSSTGPKTEKGKATSSRNAVKHEIFAGPTPIHCGPFAEDPGELERDIRAIVTGLAPEDDLELALALRIAAIFVRLWRLDRFEAALSRPRAGSTHSALPLSKTATTATSFSTKKPGSPRRECCNAVSAPQGKSTAGCLETSHRRSCATRPSSTHVCRWGHGIDSRRPSCFLAERTHLATSAPLALLTETFRKARNPFPTEISARRDQPRGGFRPAPRGPRAGSASAGQRLLVGRAGTGS